jgi:hypothetical protein
MLIHDGFTKDAELVKESKYRRRLWIIEWSFVGKNLWYPVHRKQFYSRHLAEAYPKRRGFDYRIAEYTLTAITEIVEERS